MRVLPRISIFVAASAAPPPVRFAAWDGLFCISIPVTAAFPAAAFESTVLPHKADRSLIRAVTEATLAVILRKIGC